jgi:hypothetical protein
MKSETFCRFHMSDSNKIQVASPPESSIAKGNETVTPFPSAGVLVIVKFPS